MRRSKHWMRPGDDALLESLRRDGSESGPLLAARIGMHLKYARQRCDQLAARGYIRSIDDRYYELTDRGVRYLEGTCAEDDASANAD